MRVAGRDMQVTGRDMQVAGRDMRVASREMRLPNVEGLGNSLVYAYGVSMAYLRNSFVFKWY